MNEFIAKNNTPVYQEFRYPQLKEKMKVINQIKDQFDYENDYQGMPEPSLIKSENRIRFNFLNRIYPLIFGEFEKWVNEYEIALNSYKKKSNIKDEEFSVNEIIDDIISDTESIGKTITSNLTKFGSHVAEWMNGLRKYDYLYKEVTHNFGTILPVFGSGKKILRKKLIMKHLKSKNNIKKTILNILNS